MVESVTAHYGWTKPEVTKSAATWGGFLNNDLDSIDALVFANQQGIVPIGSITMFGGATAPANWLLCQGQSLDKTTYAALFAVLQYAHGGSGQNFNLPNLTAKYPLGAGSNPLGQSGGSFNVSIAIGNLPSHAHPITDVAHSHTAQQNGHNHTIVTGNHSHTLTTGSHAHSGVFTGTTPTGGSFYPGAGGINLIQGNTSTAGNLGGNTDTAGNLGGYTDTQQPAVGVNASGTGLSTTQNVGSGTPFTVTPPFVALNFIIRFS